MIDVAGYSFPEDQACILCVHVWNGQPVLLFSHDRDGDIQFLCGEEHHDTSDAIVLGVGEIDSQLETMQDIPLVEPGYWAERVSVGKVWTVQPLVG